MGTHHRSTVIGRQQSLEMVMKLAAVLAAISVLLVNLGGIHVIREGHVGVYYRGGALLKSTSSPGYNTMIPLITTVYEVQTTLQTDSVTNVPCGTQGGVMLNFDKVEVVNMLKEEHVYDTVKSFTVNYDQPLIFDKVHHELNQFCSGNTLQEVYIDRFSQVDDILQQALKDTLKDAAPGLSILSVRVTKPRIPNSILRSYEQMEEQKTQLKVVTEKQRVIEKEAETQRKADIIAAEAAAAIAEIEQNKMISMEKAKQEISAIEDAKHVASEKAIADAKMYAMKLENEARKAKLTAEFLELKRIEAMQGTKYYFGEKIPSTFVVSKETFD